MAQSILKQKYITEKKTLSDFGFRQAGVKRLVVDPEYLAALEKVRQVAEALGSPADLGSKLDQIIYLLEGPDVVYDDRLTATATEKFLSFSDGLSIRAASIHNSGSNTAYLIFNAPAYHGQAKSYNLDGGQNLTLDFMEKADSLRYYCAVGSTTTLDVYFFLKYKKQ